jgi:Insertion element 4 transposase N-terminal
VRTDIQCLFFDEDHEEVMRRLVGTLRWLGSWRAEWKVPTRGAISPARVRVGAAPLKPLFKRVAVPVAGLGTKGAWLTSRRLMAIDGFFEIRTHQRGAKRVLRSKLPGLVEQEIWARFLSHYAIRTRMAEAADEADVDQDRRSFMRTLRVIRRQVTDQADSSP